MISKKLTSLIQKNLDEKNFSACALGIQKLGSKPEFVCMGDATPNALFDLSSLTKVVFTTTWVAKLIQESKLSIHTPISTMKEFASAASLIANDQYGKATLEDLLLHRAGFPAVAKYADICKSKNIIGCITSVKPEYAMGERTIYSDLGFIFLAELLSHHVKKDLEQVWLDLSKEFSLSSIKTTHQITTKDVVIPSAPGFAAPTIYDPAVRYFGKLCGHAGLWGNIQDLVSLGNTWLESYMNGTSLISKQTAKSFIDPYAKLDRRLGWDGVSENSTAGKITKTAFGHLGYSGTSIWIDHEKKITVALLTNRTFTQLKHVDDLIDQKHKKDFNDFRKQVHNDVWETI